jgi:hypothetical protein
MKIEALHIGMRVKHPEQGTGTVTSIGRHTAEVDFEVTGKRTLDPDLSGLTPADAHMAISGLDAPLGLFVREIIHGTVRELGFEKPDTVIEELAARWHGGKFVLHPADPTLATKEVPLDVFFHKIVMMRNNFRTMEMKVNANDKLTDAEKIELQQYISRCYGSMTTFNLLFATKEGQLKSGL